MPSLVLFDLDNTLYPESSGMDHDITRRMIEYVAAFLGMGFEEAKAFRHERAHRYGTTLEWLRTEHGFTDIETYFAAVHPAGEEYCIEANPGLGAILDSIPARKAVLTNSPMEHARRVLAKLGVADRFEAVYDIRFNNLAGKPHAEAYRRACEGSSASVADTVFIDDMPKYARGFTALGGRAVLVDEFGRYGEEGIPAVRELSELPARLASL
jgi:haloacid dehalogenase superfamily, subfamily IA, variant 3 with third motif having DD or ED